MTTSDPSTTQEQTISPSLFFALGMCMGELKSDEAVRSLALSMKRGELNPAYIRYLRDRLTSALSEGGLE